MNDRRAVAATPPGSCAVAAHAALETRLSEIAFLREGPGPAGAPLLPGRFLRHCDEQTVVGVHAVLAALAAAPAEVVGIGRHGVVGAPCSAGRLATARSLVQMRAAGAVAVSTHVVPQCSLHSLAGAISVGLAMHGPHLGVGGGPDALAEGLLVAMTLLETGVAGVWVVATRWDEEPLLDDAASPRTDPVCRALALLLVAANRDEVGLEIRRRPAPAVATAGSRPMPIADFARALALAAGGPEPSSWSSAGACPLEIRLARPLRSTPAEPHGPPAREAA